MFRKAEEALARPGRSSSQSFDSNFDSKSGFTFSEDLGLRLIHDPGPNFPVDIILVHGFGHPRLTWCHDQNPELFWPSWLISCSAPTFSIRETAEDLLSQMALLDKSPATGSAPVMFVAFSLGGLIIKQAHINGLTNKVYHEMARQFAGIIFLATPHRGDDLSNRLSKSLRLLGSADEAVAAMVPDSAVLELINYKFVTSQPI